MSDRIRESATTVEISGPVSGGILPTTQLEMNRTVILLSGAKVEDGVFGADIRVRGNVEVQGPILARKSLEIEVQTHERFIVIGGINARKSVAKKGDGPIFIEGDVYAGRLRLTNATVLGNVYADELILEDCVVRGFAFAESLQLRRTAVVSFQGNDVRLHEGVSLWLPFGLAERDLHVSHPVRCGYLSATSSSDGHDGLQCHDHLTGDCRVCRRIDPLDLHQLGFDSDAAEPDRADGRKSRMISLAPRLLELQAGRIDVPPRASQ